MNDRLSCEELKLENRPEVPYYQVLYEGLLRTIRDVQYQPGAVLPSERTLCDYLGVNRETVRRAYSLLLDMQVVQRHGNRKLVLCEDARYHALGPFPTVALILPMKFSSFIELNHQGFLKYLKGIMEEAVRCRCSITMLELPAEDCSEEEIAGFLKMLSSGSIAGVIHLGNRYSLNDAPLEALLKNTGILQVCISGSVNNSHIASLVEDNEDCLKKLWTVLRREGMDRIAFIDAFSPEEREENLQSLFHYHARIQLSDMAFRFRKQGFVSPGEWYLHSGMEGEKDWHRRLQSLMAQESPPQVLICSNPEIAGEAEKVLEGCGHRLRLVLSCNLAEKCGARKGFVHPFYQIGTAAVEYLFRCCRTGKIIPDQVIGIPSDLNF